MSHTANVIYMFAGIWEVSRWQSSAQRPTRVAAYRRGRFKQPGLLFWRVCSHHRRFCIL